MNKMFKNKNELKDDVVKYIRSFRKKVFNHSKRLNDYFEMACFNHLIKYYENRGFKISLENLVNGKFCYKLSPSGYPENFSYIKVSKERNYKKQQKKIIEYEVRHNLSIQSSYENDIYVVPDISIIKCNSIEEDCSKSLYSTKKFFFTRNSSLLTIGEAKMMVPFPELMFGFIGVYLELFKGKKRKVIDNSYHLAPCLFISGKCNPHTERIRNYLEGRYKLNIITDLYFKGKSNFSQKNFRKLNVVKHDYVKKETELKRINDKLIL